jgi:HD superfamily phosphodiesterase
MDSSLYKIIIAAYLHDMGKLLWRGDFQRKTITYKVAHAQQVYDFFNDTSKGYSEFWKEI